MIQQFTYVTLVLHWYVCVLKSSNPKQWI